jgi:hypothetical protein
LASIYLITPSFQKLDKMYPLQRVTYLYKQCDDKSVDTTFISL